jgi:hypothetical protein
MLTSASLGGLFLLASGVAGLVFVPARPFVSSVRLLQGGSTAQPLLRAAPARHSPVMAEEKGGGLPFFMDIETKGGIVFWSIVGIVSPFFVYSYLQDSLGMDVVGLAQPTRRADQRPRRSSVHSGRGLSRRPVSREGSREGKWARTLL